MNEDLYLTKSIYCASYILARNNPSVRFVGLQPGSHDKQKLFAFSNKAEAESCEAEFYSNEPIPAKTFVQELQGLKDLLFSKEVRE